MVTYKITRTESGKKLHRFLRTSLPGLPLSGIHKMLRVGRVKVNGKRGKADIVLAEGDELTLYMPEEDFAELQKSPKKFSGLDQEFEILHEDEDILVVNKPAGLLTHGDRTEQKRTLINEVLAYLHKKGELDSRLFTPSTINRLDRNTSGIVVIGKTAQALRRLNEEMREHAIRKWYLTIVHGALQGEDTITTDVTRDERTNRTVVEEDGGGKTAVTRWRTLASRPGQTLVEIELLSGRTHQIRAHMKSIGHPLIGDVKYGGRPVLGVTHQLLHAHRLRLPDGTDFRAPVPHEMGKVMEKLGFPGIYAR